MTNICDGELPEKGLGSGWDDQRRPSVAMRKERIWNDNAMDDGTGNGTARWERRSAGNACKRKHPAAPKRQVIARLNDEKSKRNYALGVSLRDGLKRQHLIELDLNLLIEGLKDALAGGKMLLTEEEVRTTLAAMQNEQRAKNIRDEIPRRPQL